MTLPATRRTVLLTSLLTTSTVALTTSCGSSDDETKKSTETTAASTTTGTELAKTTDIPVGGGKIFKAQKVVVTQPTKGEFKAFSAVCTHQGCTVATVTDGTIDCPCHKSMFSITDGAVKGGPAPRPLPEKQIAVEGDTITLT